MTVITWDGKTLAADKQGTTSDMRVVVTKIKRLPSGAVVAWCGTQEGGLEMAQWYVGGADPTKWPAAQSAPDWTRLVVAENGKVVYFETRPIPQPLKEPFHAWGSGRDYAMGALAMGADAKKAVEITSQFCTTCGMGVDSFEVGP